MAFHSFVDTVQMAVPCHEIIPWRKVPGELKEEREGFSLGLRLFLTFLNLDAGEIDLDPPMFDGRVITVRDNPADCVLPASSG